MFVLNTTRSLSLKKKLEAQLAIDKFLARAPLFGLLFLILLKLTFPKVYGPVDSAFLVGSGNFAAFAWMVELLAANHLLLAIEEIGADAYSDWVVFRLSFQLYEVWMFGWICYKSSQGWLTIYYGDSSYYFLFALLAFLAILTPYRIYQYCLLRSFQKVRGMEKALMELDETLIELTANQQGDVKDRLEQIHTRLADLGCKAGLLCKDTGSTIQPLEKKVSPSPSLVLAGFVDETPALATLVVEVDEVNRCSNSQVNLE